MRMYSERMRAPVVLLAAYPTIIRMQSQDIISCMQSVGNRGRQIIALRIHVGLHN